MTSTRQWPELPTRLMNQNLNLIANYPETGTTNREYSMSCAGHVDHLGVQRQPPY